jgi:DNA-binding NarL/FixJ family response regulator
MKGEATGRIVEAVRGVQEGRIYVNAETMNRLAKRLVGRKAPAGEPVGTLSEREKEVFRRLGRGRTTREIADELNLSIKTIQAFCDRIRFKLGLTGSSQLVREAVRWVETSKPGPTQGQAVGRN